MVDIFGQFVCGLKQSQSGSRSLSPDHAAAAIVIAARSSRVNIDSPLGIAVHTTELGPGMRLQIITSNNYSQSKKLGIDTGWKTTISGDSDMEHTWQTLTPARTRSWRSCSGWRMSRRRRAQKCWATYSGRVRLLAAGGKSDENILAGEWADICLHQVPDPGAHWRFWPTLLEPAPLFSLMFSYF